jgi:hypothetical protein
LSISCGNLLTGTTTKLDAIDIKTIQFNETIESSSKTQTSVKDLISKLDLLRENAKDQ